MSGANAPTDTLASGMKRDPAFALAVGSLERCLRVRERVGSSLIVGRPGKPPGSGGFDAAVCEKESKGLVSDSVEVVRRSGAMGAVRDRSETDFKGKFSCGASGAGVARCAATVTAFLRLLLAKTHVYPLEEQRLRLFLQSRVRVSMDCLRDLSLIFQESCRVHRS